MWRTHGSQSVPAAQVRNNKGLCGRKKEAEKIESRERYRWGTDTIHKVRH